MHSSDARGVDRSPIATLILSGWLDQLAQALEFRWGQAGFRTLQQGGDGLFERALEKRVEHSTGRRTANLDSAASRGVDVATLPRAMPGMSLLDEDCQQGSHGGITRRSGQGGKDGGRGDFAMGMDDVHDLPLAAARGVRGSAAHRCKIIGSMVRVGETILPRCRP